MFLMISYVSEAAESEECSDIILIIVTSVTLGLVCVLLLGAVGVVSYWMYLLHQAKHGATKWTKPRSESQSSVL